MPSPSLHVQLGLFRVADVRPFCAREEGGREGTRVPEASQEKNNPRSLRPFFFMRRAVVVYSSSAILTVAVRSYNCSAAAAVLFCAHEDVVEKVETGQNPTPHRAKRNPQSPVCCRLCRGVSEAQPSWNMWRLFTYPFDNTNSLTRQGSIPCLRGWSPCRGRCYANNVISNLWPLPWAYYSMQLKKKNEKCPPPSSYNDSG